MPEKQVEHLQEESESEDEEFIITADGEKKPKKMRKKVVKPVGSLLAASFETARFPDCSYWRSIDVCYVQQFFTPKECEKIIECAESMGFAQQAAHQAMRLSYSDIVDASLGHAIWNQCGLGHMLKPIRKLSF